MRRDALLTSIGTVACLLLTAFNVVPHMKFDKTAIVQEKSAIVVSVSGEVVNPGMYELAWGAKLEDAIRAAGGFNSGADQHLVNLAMPVDSGEAIFVPSVQTEKGESRVSINGSSQAELETLPRIGPAMAQRIIEARPFNRIEDLLKVKGTGDKTLEKMRPFVTL